MFSRATLLLVVAALLVPRWAHGQTLAVAITVDDLPYVQGDSDGVIGAADAKQASVVNDRILTALERHHAAATGFVIQKRVEELGTPAGSEILRGWTKRGFDLGNHLYSHPDINGLSMEQIEDEIIRGEPTISSLMTEARKKLEFLRFPYNHTGDTKEKHHAIAGFLASRGYRVASSTIDNSDYVFNQAYVLMLSRHEDGAAERLRSEYVLYTAKEIEYYSALNKTALGYEPPHIMLLHDNQLNADVIDDVLGIFEKKQYRFRTLSEAESDAAYRRPDTFITQYGPMWGYRWAAERNIKVDGRAEPDPPLWIVQYITAAAKKP